MATVKFDVVARLPEGKDGKRRYHKCGVCFEGDKGLSIKLDSLPAGGQFDGWLQLYAPKPREDAQQRKAAPTQAEPFVDDDVPFN